MLAENYVKSDDMIRMLIARKMPNGLQVEHRRRLRKNTRNGCAATRSSSSRRRTCLMVIKSGKGTLPPHSKNPKSLFAGLLSPRRAGLIPMDGRLWTRLLSGPKNSFLAFSSKLATLSFRMILQSYITGLRKLWSKMASSKRSES